MDNSNKAVKFFELYAIGAAITNIFLFPFVLTVCGKNIGLDVNSFPIATCYMGTVFSYSLFFYICFMQTLESEIDKLPGNICCYGTDNGSMNTVNDSVVNQASGVDKTYSTINLMMEKIKGLNQSVEVQTAGSTQVLQSISEIKNSADVVKNNSDSLLDGGNQIVEEMGILAELTEEIIESIRQMATGTEQITNAIGVVTESSNENKESLTQVFENVSDFTLPK